MTAPSVVDVHHPHRISLIEDSSSSSSVAAAVMNRCTKVQWNPQGNCKAQELQTVLEEKDLLSRRPSIIRRSVSCESSSSQPSQPRNKRKRRRVRVQLVPTEIHVLDNHYAESILLHKDDLWYTAEGLREFKRDAKRVCSSVDIEDVIQEAYSACSTTLASADTSQAQKMMKASSQLETQRGLERLSSRYHGLCRNLEILHTRTEVFIYQASQLLNGDCQSDGNNDNDHGEQLAKAYGDACQPAARFARLMAVMDAAQAAEP